VKLRDRIKKLVRVQASELLPNPKNWRTHPAAQKDALRGILAEVGMADACLARELPDGSLMLIDGHARAELMGENEVPVLVLDVTEQEADKILATFDPVSAMALKDSEKLAELLAELKATDDILAGLVWPDYVVDPLLAADWSPDEIEDLPTNDNASKGHSLQFSDEAWEIINEGVKKLRAVNDDKAITPAKAVELIVAEYLG